MYCALTCDIKIGSASFTSVNEVKVTRSIHSIGNTAVINVPLWALIKKKSPNGEQQFELKDTTQQFKVDDKVVIKLGYNGRLKEEFTGFVKRINFKKPLEIECEDWAYPLRRINMHKSWKTVTVKELLEYIKEQAAKIKITGYSGFDIVGDIPTATLEKWSFENKTALWALQELKEKCGLGMYFNPDGNLYCGLLYGQNRGTVKYNFGLNVIDPSDLKWQDANDVKLKVKIISYTKSGQEITGEVGDASGEVRTLHFYNIKTQAELKAAAQATLDKYKYTGYRGNILTFLEPYAQPCMVADITDPQYTQRSGKYYIEAVETTFGQSGARRKVSIGIKV